MRAIKKLLGLTLIIVLSLSVGYYYGQKQATNKPTNPLAELFSKTDEVLSATEKSLTKTEETENTSSQPDVQKTDPDLAVIEARIHELVNKERESQGLLPLTINPQLVKASRQRSKEIVTDFSHERGGESSFSIFKEPEYQYVYQAVGENIVMATYQGTAEEMGDYFFKLWKESPGHYENIISPKFSEVGTGIYLENGILYGTQLFGNPRS